MPGLAGATTISANLGRISRAGASPAPTIHGPGGLIRALVGATLAVALGGGGVWLKFAPMGATLAVALGGMDWFRLCLLDCKHSHYEFPYLIIRQTSGEGNINRSCIAQRVY